ncbi:hypothetical protein N9L68_06410 [bacterium]|nr:hypothetical protein [bacterium]
MCGRTPCHATPDSLPGCRARKAVSGRPTLCTLIMVNGGPSSEALAHKGARDWMGPWRGSRAGRIGMMYQQRRRPRGQ